MASEHAGTSAVSRRLRTWDLPFSSRELELRRLFCGTQVAAGSGTALAYGVIRAADNTPASQDDAERSSQAVQGVDFEEDQAVPA